MRALVSSHTLVPVYMDHIVVSLFMPWFMYVMYADGTSRRPCSIKCSSEHRRKNSRFSSREGEEDGASK